MHLKIFHDYSLVSIKYYVWKVCPWLCVNCHSLFFLICSAHLKKYATWTLSSVWNLRKLEQDILHQATSLWWKRSEIRTTFRRLHSILEKLPDTLPQKYPYLMRFEENFALSYQMTAFFLLRLAYGQILYSLKRELLISMVWLSKTPLNIR